MMLGRSPFASVSSTPLYGWVLAAGRGIGKYCLAVGNQHTLPGVEASITAR